MYVGSLNKKQNEKTNITNKQFKMFRNIKQQKIK